ncbi:MAG TPA: NAD(P)/FAD-dependent oxidoreductase [Dehalococcoidia bacterium]|nr:NAD(P)/FAD-dependent oxidoreductase [Dehalococcoidia bacterium]
MNSETPVSVQSRGDLDVIVVGGGLGGLYTLYKMRELGLRARAFEAGSGLGGTWFWNRYPGCRCDIESLEYSYSFSPELEQDWHWPDRYGTQPQILEYIEHVADRFDLRKEVQLNTRVLTAHFDSMDNLWTITTDKGDRVSAPCIVMATGNLSTPRVPEFPGLSSFRGDWYHTGMWPHEGVDFTGKRVGIIGTGSSGVQSIPFIAQQAKHLHVFQRTANFILPARNAPMDPERERAHKAKYRDHRVAAYDTPFGMAGHPPPTKSALEATAEEREAAYAAKWEAGGSISYLYSYTDLLLDEKANETASEFVRARIREIVRDPRTAELLCPNDHPIGTKRLILDTNYYEVFNRDNVTLVDARSTPIECITEDGLRTSDASFEFDAIVFATGFDAMTGALREIDIRADTGTEIRSKWADGPHTYLGIMMAGFPNLFMVTGPQSPGVKSQMILSIEQHVNFIAGCLAHMRGEGYSRIEADQDAEDRWVKYNDEVAHSTLYPKANSWYMGANIPGKPRIFMPYVGGVHTYNRLCNDIVAKGYQGFTLSRPAVTKPEERSDLSNQILNMTKDVHRITTASKPEIQAQ